MTRVHRATPTSSHRGSLKKAASDSLRMTEGQSAALSVSEMPVDVSGIAGEDVTETASEIELNVIANAIVTEKENAIHSGQVNPYGNETARDCRI
jgi:hypothetical protein